MRLGNMYGPDATFAGVPAADLSDPSSFADAAAVIIGAPFDGGTSHRSGCRFGPQAIRFTDYLPHDGMRPSLALGVDPLTELGVVDVGDVEMPSGETELSLRPPRGGGRDRGPSGAIPVVLGGDHTIAFPDATGCARHVGWGRVSMIHFDAHADTANDTVRPAGGPRHADAPPDRVGRRAGRPLPPGRAAGLLARAGDARLDGGAGDAELRDDRGGRPAGSTPA